MPARPLVALVGVAIAAAALTGCVAESDVTPTPTTPSVTPSSTPDASSTLAPFPIGTATSTTALPANLPDGCRDILTDAVLAELDGVPLNAPGMGGGIRADGARVCVWGDPDAAATRLTTIIGYSPERDARDALYALSVDEGYTCYEPDDGIRCEKTWEHATLPVQEGRTLFYRDGVIVDTQYTNLAPTGYTAAIIDALWPAGSSVPRSTPTPTPSETP